MIKSSHQSPEPKITGNSLSEINALNRLPPPSEHRNPTLFFSHLLAHPALSALPKKICTIHAFIVFFHKVSISSSPPLSLLLPRLRRHRARHGPEEPAAHHRRQEGLDQHPGAAAQTPAPELPGPRLSGQSSGRGPDGGLLHQRLIGGKHQGDYEPLACPSVCLSASLPVSRVCLRDNRSGY